MKTKKMLTIIMKNHLERLMEKALMKMAKRKVKSQNRRKDVAIFNYQNHLLLGAIFLKK